MYIAYDRDQQEAFTRFGFLRRTATHPLRESKESTFRPTWLVRVEDMKPVRGEEVQDEYWALSYSWNQSGEIIQVAEEEFRREDHGKHVVISPHMRRRKHVKFEGLVQQMCKDFGIRYIWFDQKCINQGDHDEKIREIKRMHMIYHHAACTLALVPELEYKYNSENDPSDQRVDMTAIARAEWSKRIWTLEESYMSRYILFLGKNVHSWSQSIGTGPVCIASTEYFINNICANSITWNASTVLWFARTRTSSKSHDTIFALVNMFPELKDKLTFGYKQPLVPLMIQFYQLLIEKDLSMLLFGAPMDDTLPRMWRKGDDLLPSWTGIHGLHIPQDATDSGFVRDNFANYKVNKEALSVLCTCISVTIQVPVTSTQHGESYTEDGLPWHGVDASHGNEPLHTTSEGTSLIFVATTPDSQVKHNSTTRDYGLRATHFLPMKETSRNSWVNTMSSPTRVGGWLSLTEAECSECIILMGICFDRTNAGYIVSPVVMRTKDNYKSIGICVFRHNLQFDSSLETEQTIVIE